MLRAYSFILAAAVMWGSMGVFVKTLYSWGVTPWSLTFYRALLGFLACALFVLILNRSWFLVQRRHLPFLAVYGLIGTSAFFALYLFTLSLNSVAVAVVLLYTAPVMASIMARFAFRERLTVAKWAALALSFAGCALVAGVSSATPVASGAGVAVGLGSGLAYAFLSVMSKKGREWYGSWTLQLYSFGFGTLFLLPVLALPETSLGPYSWPVWGLLLLVAAGPSLMARVLYVAALKEVEASRASIVATVEPVAAALFAFFLLGETLSSSQMLGGLLVLVGAALAQRPGRRSPAKPPVVAYRSATGQAADLSS